MATNRTVQTPNINRNKDTMTDLSNLPEQALKEELKKRASKSQQERKAYKELVNDSLTDIINKFIMLSDSISEVKKSAFQDLKTLLEAKCEAYEVADKQQSHTFSDNKGNTITYGFRVVDDWDDTLSAGIAKAEEYLKTLAKDEESAKLVDGIHRLLKKDAKGNLKASRVIELSKWADDLGDEGFIDAVKIIRDAYKPKKSAYFIDVYRTNAQNKKENIPLNISSVDFPEGTDIDSLFPVHETYN